MTYADEALDQFARNFPQFHFSADQLPKIRAMAKKAEEYIDHQSYGVNRQEVFVKTDDVRPLRLVWYSPLDALQTAPSLPVLLHFHGGGYVIGRPEDAERQNTQLCAALKINIISVDYRLAPEHPFPAALHDATTALNWCNDALGIAYQNIAIGGESAGAGLAVSLALYCSEHNIRLAGQSLAYPMLDPTNVRSSAKQYAIWTSLNNQFAWHSYLPKSEYSSSLIVRNAKHLSSLPKTWIGVGDEDLFYQENRALANALYQRCVECDLVVYKRAFHSFDRALRSKLALQFQKDRLNALESMLLHYSDSVSQPD